MSIFFNNIYSGKRVLITGNTGFKGSWLSLWLQSLGANVMGVALKPQRQNDHFFSANLSEHMDCNFIDIRDYNKIQNIIDSFKPEIIFHLAAQALVGASYKDPMYTIETNMIGTLNILEALRNYDGQCSSVFITSDKCYRNVEQMWGYRENDLLGGDDPYSTSKAGAELIINTYIKSFPEIFENSIASTRAGNVIGGGDWSEQRLVPDCFRALTAKEPIIIRNSNSTRPWQFVLEPLSGYLLLGEKLISGNKGFSSGWNFGPSVGETHTVLEVAKEIIKFWGEGKIQENSSSNKFYESTLLQLDCTKAMAKLDWKPILNFQECIEFTTNWYRYNYNNSNTDMHAFGVSQIEEYQNEAISSGAAWASKS